MNVGIVDYGMGNIKSIVSAFRYIGVDTISVTSDCSVLKVVDKLVLPGVGSFKKAMENIHRLHLCHFLHSMIIEEKKPVLGICLGMQLLAKQSTEDGGSDGLGIIEGEVTKIDAVGIRVPHVGFNQVNFYSDSKLYSGMVNNSDFYFTHSYKMLSQGNTNQSICHYGGVSFVASYEFDHIAGTQFHPELSQTNGLKLLKNFIEKF